MAPAQGTGTACLWAPGSSQGLPRPSAYKLFRRGVEDGAEGSSPSRRSSRPPPHRGSFNHCGFLMFFPGHYCQ